MNPKPAFPNVSGYADAAKKRIARQEISCPSKYAIIGIHGIAPKPPNCVLKEYWYKALTDGLLSRTHPGQPLFSLEKRCREVPYECFELAYWADLVHRPLPHDTEPYVPLQRPPPSAEEGSCFAKARKCASSVLGPCFDTCRATAGSRCTEVLASKIGHFGDATEYWQSDRQRGRSVTKAQAIRSTLKTRVERAVLDGKRVLILAHSMGSMVAYDVCADLSMAMASKVSLVTLGSPLGSATVKLNHKTDALHVRSWDNFSDLRDPVCYDAFLADDYNGVTDHVVVNDYTCEKGQRTLANSHKSYGYLRCPEVAEVVKKFIDECNAA